MKLKVVFLSLLAMCIPLISCTMNSYNTYKVLIMEFEVQGDANYVDGTIRYDVKDSGHKSYETGTPSNSSTKIKGVELKTLNSQDFINWLKEMTEGRAISDDYIEDIAWTVLCNESSLSIYKEKKRYSIEVARLENAKELEMAYIGLSQIVR